MSVHRGLLPILLVPAVLMVSCDGRPKQDTSSDVRRVILPADEVHEGWYFAAGPQVVIEGTINGDAYVAGGMVTIDGTVNGDLLVAGGTVTVNGTVTDDIRAGGGNIQISGKAGRNVSAAGGSITVGKNAEIGGGLLAACGSMQQGGKVANDAVLTASDASVTGEIGGRVRFTGGHLEVHRGAIIGGDVDVRVGDPEDVVVADGTVRGKVTITTEEYRPAPLPAVPGPRPWSPWMKVLWTLSLIGTALALTFLLPKQLAGTGEAIIRHPGKSALWGLIGLVGGPVITLLLFVTLIGIPLGLFVLTSYLWFLYLTQLALAVAVARLIVGTDGKSGWKLFLAASLGVVITQIVILVPYLGTLIVIAGMLFGMGAILLQFEERGTKARSRAS